MKERIKIATALGYYARATDPEAKTLAAAFEAHALAEYRDNDCQIAFRKGYQQAEEHARGSESEEVAKLGRFIVQLANEIRYVRELLELKAERRTIKEDNPGKWIAPPPLAADLAPNGASGGGNDSRMLVIDHSTGRIEEISGGGGGCGEPGRISGGCGGGTAFDPPAGGGGCKVEKLNYLHAVAIDPDTSIAIDKLKERKSYRWHAPVYEVAPPMITEDMLNRAFGAALDRLGATLGAPERLSGIGDTRYRQLLFDFIASRSKRKLRDGIDEDL